MSFEDLGRREVVIEAVKNAVRECFGAEAEEVEFVRSVMGKDWVVLEYEARTRFAALRPRLIFTKGDPAKAMEEAERVLQSGGL
nr:hypothetical protein [Pyrobaculum arsenaticum]